MARYQIANGSGRGYEVTLFVDANTDPALDITIILQEVTRTAGLNSREVPVGHLPNEYQVTIIDDDNAVFKALDGRSTSNCIVEIKKGGVITFEGNVTLKSSSYAFKRSVGNPVLVCHDGIVNLQTISASEYYCEKRTIGTLFEELLHATGHPLDVNLAIGLAHNNVAGTGYERIENHRGKVNSLTRDLDSPMKSDLLERLCEDFEVCVFQEDGAWYVLDNYERALGITEVYNITAGITEAVSFGTGMDDSDYRENNNKGPELYKLPDPSEIETINDLGATNTDILNDEFDNWSEGDVYPLSWCYDDPATFSRGGSIENPTLEGVQMGGRLVYQMIPVANGLLEPVNLKFNAQVTFGADGDNTGTLIVQLARLRAFSELTVYGYDQQSNEWNGDGWLELSHNYPNASSETKTLDIDLETDTVGGFSVILLELYFDVSRTGPGDFGSAQDPEYFQASVELINEVKNTQQVTYIGNSNEPLTRISRLADRRKYFGISDMEYYDGTEWQETDNWDGSGLIKDDLLTQRRAYIWDKPVAIIESPVSATRDFKLFEEVEIDVLGETKRFIPLRIKRSAKSLQGNSVMFLECDKRASIDNMRTEYR